MSHVNTNSNADKSISRKPHAFKVEITLLTPYLVHGNDPGRWGLDATLLRNAHGCPVLPGTLIAGRVADIWLNHGHELGLQNVDAWLNDWLGKAGNGPLAADAGQRARLRVSDLVLTQINETPWSPVAEEPITQTRIALDADTGSVQRGALLVAEQLAAPGTPLHFEGTWHAWASDNEASTLAQQLQIALCAQTQIGADRSVGFGVVHGVRVSEQAMPTAPVPPIIGKNTPQPLKKLRLQLLFSEHFCITQRLHNGNLFKGGDVIPGGAILGALAQTLCQAHGVPSVGQLRERSVLARHFDTLRCTHAHPALQTQATRPVPIPFSWVRTPAGLRDVWRCAQPQLVPGQAQAPAFLLDWKEADFAAATAVTRWPNVPRHLRVRTALQDGQARDGQLFAYESRYSHQGHEALHWLADLHLPPEISDADQQSLLQELQQLTQAGLGPIGKTDAQADVTWVGATATALTPETTTPDFKPEELIALRLNSPALLLHAKSLANQPIQSAACAYAAAFEDLLSQAGAPGALAYSHHFARERLVGGTALQHRYRLGHEQPNASAYQPLLLTEAGSVFVFTVQPSPNLGNTLQKWLQNGLPLPTPVKQAHGATWQDHPYTTANGYGEVALHTAHPDVPELIATA